ncbi:MAG TPA: T9SS type A sorting domain-containing protein [Bacteroidia bacterium]|nr:T9SS type A sorting domain-containing protein [Bacteroidia bacterium]
MKKLLLAFSGLAMAACVNAQVTTVTYNYTGTIDMFTVPSCVTSITIEARGAQGGQNTSSTTTSGLGATMIGTFSVTPGDQLKILVGQQPSAGSGNGGGGGTFVTDISNNPLIVAGGGGGSSQGADSPDKNGQVGTTGGTGAGGGGIGGTAGNGGSIGASGFQSGAGGGLLTNGADGWTTSTGGMAFVNGGSGGTANAPANGGFGGGGSGSSYVVGGGGGGYSGGGSGGNSTAGVGGGGGSFNAGTNQNNTGGANSGNGMVIITYTTGPGAGPASISGPLTVCEGSTVTYTAATVPGATSYTWTVPSGWTIVSGQGTNSISLTVDTNPGTIDVTASDACGTSPATSLSIGVDMMPSAGTVSADSAICSGSTIGLASAGSAGTVTWYEYDGMNYNSLGSGATFTTSPYTAGTYSFVAVANSGVCADDTSAAAVTIVDSVSVGGTASSSIGPDLCAGSDPLLMSAGATGSIEWMFQFNGQGPFISFGTGNPFDPGPPSNQDTGSYVFYAIATSGVCAADTSNSFMVNVRPTPVVMLGSDTAQCSGSIVLDAQNAGEMFVWNNGPTTQTDTVSSTGTYMVTVTTMYGCSSSDTIMVTINPNPVVDLGADVQQCGGTVTLDAMNNGSSYVWNDNSTGQTLSAASSGTYFVDVTDANGCMGSDTVNVTINTPPTVTGTASSTSACVDDADVALTGSPVGGTWSGPSVTGSSFDPSIGAGNYSPVYSFTDGNGCTGTASVSITVNACTGVAEQKAANGVSLYPNPNNGVFTLDVNADVNQLTIEITDVQGRVVYTSDESGVRSGYAKQISLNDQPDGIYFVRVTADGQLHTEKISVIR